MLKPTPVWHAARKVGSRRLYSADTMRSVSREKNEWAHFSRPTNGVLFAGVVGKHVCNIMQPLLQRVRHEVKREVENTAPGGTILYQRCFRTWKLSWCCQNLFSQEIKANRSVSLFLICWLMCLYHFLFVASVYESVVNCNSFAIWQKPQTHRRFLCLRFQWCWKRNTEEDKSCWVVNQERNSDKVKTRVMSRHPSSSAIRPSSWLNQETHFFLMLPTFFLRHPETLVTPVRLVTVTRVSAWSFPLTSRQCFACGTL